MVVVVEGIEVGALGGAEVCTLGGAGLGGGLVISGNPSFITLLLSNLS